MATKTASSGSKRKAAPTSKGASATSAKKARLNDPKKTNKVPISESSDDTSDDDLDNLDNDDQFDGLDDSDSEDGGTSIKPSASRKDKKKTDKKQTDGGKEIAKGTDISAFLLLSPSTL